IEGACIMGGGGTQTSTQSTAPNNPAVDATTTQLLTGLQNQYASGSKVFGQSLQPGMSGTTLGGINATNQAANAGAGGLNSAYGWDNGVVNSGGYNPALSGAQSGIQDYLRE